MNLRHGCRWDQETGARRLDSSRRDALAFLRRTTILRPNEASTVGYTASDTSSVSLAQIPTMSASDSSSEEDFMSDAFLAKVAAPPAGSSSVSKKSSAGQTYQEKRRLARLESERKNKANATKSYREREENARQEGMSKNLFEKELEAESGPGTVRTLLVSVYLRFYRE